MGRFGRITVKILLSVAFIGILTFTAWTAYFLFQQMDNPLLGSDATAGIIALLASAAALFITGRLLRSHPYKRTPPSFKMALLSLLCAAVVCTFAGLEPLASYKDDIIDRVRGGYTDWQESREEDREQSRLASEQEILNLVNQARAASGLSPLTRVGAIDALAFEHSEHMAATSNLSHEGFDARADQIILMLGTSYIGENVAMGYDCAKAFVQGWLDSPGHRQNIMNPSFTRTGIGCYGSYATQIFCD